jgi:hypothetical protein
MSHTRLDEIVQEVKQKVPFVDLFREFYPDNVLSNGLALCPWHDDRNPSLSLRKNAGLCHGACSNANKTKRYDVFDLYKKRHGVDFKTAREALAERCGIIAKPEQDRKPSREPIASYRYTDESGNVLYEVCRFEPKDFRQRRPNGNGGWIWNLKDTRRVLYRLPQVLQAETVWLCEGEKDADNLHALDLSGTTSPQGAGKWPKLCAEYKIHEPLRGKHVLICPDNDEQGRKHAEDVGRSLHGLAAAVKIITLPDLPEKGDVSDFIEQHGPEQAKAKLLEIAERTPPYKSRRTGPEIITFSDLMDMTLPEPQWVIHGLLPEGLCILAGAPKIGKSWLAQHLSLSIAAGDVALSVFRCKQGAVLHLALEDTTRRFRKRMSTMLRDTPAPALGMFSSTWPHFSDSEKEPGGLDLIHQWLEKHRELACAVIIDTFVKVRPRKPHNKDDLYSRDYHDLEGLQQLAGQYAVAIVVVHHQNKGSHEDVFNTISGSTGITGAADTIMILDKPARNEPTGTLFVSGRDIEELKGAVRFDRETGLWRWLGDDAELKMSNERREIRNILREAEGPLAPSDIAKLTGKRTTAIHNLLTKMVAAGEVVKAVGQHGKYALPPDDDSYGEPWRPNQGASYSQEEIHLDHI